MTDDRLEQDLCALAAAIEDPEEAAALRDLFEIASSIAIQTDDADEFTPFVYPH